MRESFQTSIYEEGYGYSIPTVVYMGTAMNHCMTKQTIIDGKPFRIDLCLHVCLVKSSHTHAHHHTQCKLQRLSACLYISANALASQ